MKDFTFESNKLYYLMDKEGSKLMKYDENNNFFDSTSFNLEGRTLFQFNYNRIINAYKIKCVYTFKNDSAIISNILDIKKNYLSKYLFVNSDENDNTQYWIIKAIDSEHFIIINKVYPNLALTMRKGAVSLSNFDFINSNIVYKDNQLFKIKELGFK